MTLWRLEWLRVIRTKKWVALAAGYLFFGLTGPPLVRYTAQILKRVGGGVVPTVKPTAADGIASYTKNAGQIGLVVLVVVAAGTLAVDANPEWSVFLRTRVRRASRLLLPRAVATSALGGAMFIFGAFGTWYETRVLLGSVSASGMLIGMLLGVAFIAFVVAVVMLATTLVRGVLGVVGLTMGGILVLPLAGLIHPIQQWMPTQLIDAMHGLVAGAHAGDYVRSLAVSVVLAVVLAMIAMQRFARREV